MNKPNIPAEYGRHGRGENRAVAMQVLADDPSSRVGIQPRGLVVAFPLPTCVASLLTAADRFRFILFAILGGMLLLGLNGEWQVEPDSALYLVLARNIAAGHGYTYHGLPHHLVYPGLPYIMAGLFRMFPGREIAACNGFIVACAGTSLGLTYRLFLLSFGRPTAAVITVLAGIAHEYFRYCYEIMPEIPFLAGVMAVLAGFEGVFHHHRALPRWWDWSLFIIGVFAVINLKPMMFPLLLLCIATMPWWTGRRDITRRCLAAAVLIIALLALFLCYDPRHPFSAGASSSYEQLAVREASRFPNRWHAVLARNLSDLFGRSLARSVIGVPVGNTVVNVFIGMAIMISALSLIRHRPLWGLWVTAVIAKLALLYSHDRYLLPILPLLIFAWWRLICWICSRFSARVGNYVFALLMIASIVPNLVKAGSTLIEQHLHPFLTYYHGGRAAALDKIGHELAGRADAQDIIFAPAGTSRVLTYFSDRTVFEFPGPARLPLARRIFIVVPIEEPDAEFNDWTSRLKIIRGDAPLYTYVCPVKQGGSFAIFKGRFGAR